MNTNQIVDYARHLVNIGVKGVYILGTTGESFALTFEEKCQLINAWHEALIQLDREDKHLLAIVNVSAMSIKESEPLARLVSMQLNRFNGIALLAPIFYKVGNANQLVSYIGSILNKTDGQIPFLYYHFPDRTGQQNFELESFVEKAMECLPQFSAIKFTDTNIVRMGKIQRKFGDKIKIFAGYDETLLAARITLNIDAGICATFSLENCVQYYLSILDSVDKGDLIRAQQNQQMLAKTCEQLQMDGNFFHSLKQRLNGELSSKGLQFGSARSPVWIQLKN